MANGEVGFMLLERVRRLMAVDLRSLVERAVGQASLAEMDQYLREAEDHLASLEDAADAARQIIQVLEGKLAEHKQKAASLDRAVEAFLQEGNDAGAAASQSRQNSLGHLVESYAGELRRQEHSAQQMAAALETLEARHHALRALRVEAQGVLALVQEGRAGGSLSSMAALAAAGDGEVRRRAKLLAAQLEALSPGTPAEAASPAEQIELVLDRQRVAAQLAARRSRRMETGYNPLRRQPG
jgi:chromosome segregation ATPase